MYSECILTWVSSFCGRPPRSVAATSHEQVKKLISRPPLEPFAPAPSVRRKNNNMTLWPFWLFLCTIDNGNKRSEIRVHVLNKQTLMKTYTCKLIYEVLVTITAYANWTYPYMYCYCCIVCLDSIFTVPILKWHSSHLVTSHTCWYSLCNWPSSTMKIAPTKPIPGQVICVIFLYDAFKLTTPRCRRRMFNN